MKTKFSDSSFSAPEDVLGFDRSSRRFGGGSLCHSPGLEAGIWVRQGTGLGCVRGWIKDER